MINRLSVQDASVTFGKSCDSGGGRVTFQKFNFLLPSPMLDRHALLYAQRLLAKSAQFCHRHHINANTISWVGFAIGLAVPLLIWKKLFMAAALGIIANRICDGLDGMVARLQGTSDAGAFLDIVLDFLFYGAVVLGFALADPQTNGAAAALLLFSFLGTGSSFLSFAILAERRQLINRSYPSKGIYYLGGLTEGTETIVVFLLFCLFPGWFALLATGFAVLCLITTATRITFAVSTLRG
jgi:phosphatidylglycerophosphate synthase